MISAESVINNYVSCFHVLRDVKGSGCTDHTCLDGSSTEHNTFQRSIMMPIDHFGPAVGVGGFNGVALMKAYKVHMHESHGSLRQVRKVLERFLLIFPRVDLIFSLLVASSCWIRSLPGDTVYRMCA